MTQAPGAVATSDEADKLGFWAARQICRSQSNPFYLPSFFLKPAKRQAVHALLAFCGMAREAIAQPGGGSCSASEMDDRVALFQDRLDEIYHDRLELPLPRFRSPQQHVLHAMATTLRRCEVPRHYFDQYARGCRADVSVKRYATWVALEKHCSTTAGAVALAVTAVLGLTNSGAAVQVVYAGTALELTRILCDVTRDWKRGHLYLPLEDMVRFGYRERDLSAGVVNGAFAQLMRFEIARARELYRLAAEGVCWLGDETSRLAASAALVMRCGALDAIEREGYDVFGKRARLTTGQKFRRIGSAWRLARRRYDRPLPARVFGPR